MKKISTLTLFSVSFLLLSLLPGGYNSLHASEVKNLENSISPSSQISYKNIKGEFSSMIKIPNEEDPPPKFFHAVSSRQIIYISDVNETSKKNLHNYINLKNQLS